MAKKKTSTRKATAKKAPAARKKSAARKSPAAKKKPAAGAKDKYAGNKTRPVKKTATTLLESVQDEKKRADCKTLLKIMKKVTGKPAVVWGGSIIGFGTYHYKYASGREGDFFIAGFSPRVQNIVVYVMSGFKGEAELMGRLGKHKTGKACLYLKRLEDVDLKVLEELIARSVAHMRKKYDVK